MPGYQTRVQGSEEQQTDWTKALEAASMSALANGANTETMLGFALGKWLSNYFNRGNENRDQSIRDNHNGYGTQLNADTSTTPQTVNATSLTETATPAGDDKYNYARDLTVMLGGGGNQPSTTYNFQQDLLNANKDSILGQKLLEQGVGGFMNKVNPNSYAAIIGSY